jgi:hypothetical protein
MTQYCYIQDGAIVDGPRSLPKVWYNISGLDLLPDEKLATLGWFPVEDSKATIDPKTEAETAPVLAVVDGKATRVIGKRDLTEEEIVERKASAVRSVASADEIIEAILQQFESQVSGGLTVSDKLAAILVARANARK